MFQCEQLMCCVSKRWMSSRRSCGSPPCALSGRGRDVGASPPPWLPRPHPPPPPPTWAASHLVSLPWHQKKTSARANERDPKGGQKRKGAKKLIYTKLIYIYTIYYIKWVTHLVIWEVRFQCFCQHVSACSTADLHQQHWGKQNHEKRLHLRAKHLRLQQQTQESNSSSLPSSEAVGCCESSKYNTP